MRRERCVHCRDFSENSGDWLVAMPERSCRVTIRHTDGIDHTVQVMAATLYKAVARGLVAMCLRPCRRKVPPLGNCPWAQKASGGIARCFPYKDLSLLVSLNR